MSATSMANSLVTETNPYDQPGPEGAEATPTSPAIASVLPFPSRPLSEDDARRRNGFQRTRAMLWGADLAIAACGIAAAVWRVDNISEGIIVAFAVLWLAFMTIRHTRDGRIADLTDLRRVASMNVHFVLFSTVVTLFVSRSVHGTQSAFAITSGIAVLALGARWSLTQPAVRRCLGLSLDERVLVVGDLESVSRTITEWEGLDNFRIVGVCLSESDSHVHSVKDIEVLGNVTEVAAVISRTGVDIVAIHDVDKLGGLQLAKLQWALEEVGAQLSVITPVTNTVEARATVRRAGRRLIVDLAHGRPRGAVAALKGAVDRVVAAVLLIFALPAIAVFAVLIKVTSPGPVIFRQIRIREHGAAFTMYKLRTMTVDAEDRLAELLDANEVGGGLFKIKSDPRVTRVGTWLRKLSIDELPQLWNVVIGDMSLIGPRPALPHEVQTYDEWARRRLAVKPGLTGLWQVSGRSNLSWSESVRIDSDYVDNWRPRRELAIALRTIKVVLSRNGAH
jgi:exopolysaccharide biosynthesis polyprenyl glycosylphosphotransferase